MKLHRLLHCSAFALLILLGVLYLQSSVAPPSPTHAQEGPGTATCDIMVAKAVQQIGSACREMGRNEACYGNTLVSASLRDEAASSFEAVGDIVGVLSLEAIITRPANPKTNEWGIAVMDLQADLPENEIDSVRMVMFGGVELNPNETNRAERLYSCQFTNSGNASINLRSGPGTHYRLVDILESGKEMLVYGKSLDEKWLRSSRGWAYAPYGTLSCEGDPLAIINNPSDAYTAPMQNFTFQINEQGQCQSAPAGLLVQAPTGKTANILVNNVEIRIGSTALLTINDKNEMIVANLEGNVAITSDDVTLVLPPEWQASVLMVDKQASGIPYDLRPIEAPITWLDPRLLSLLPETFAAPESFESPPPSPLDMSSDTLANADKTATAEDDAKDDTDDSEITSLTVSPTRTPVSSSVASPSSTAISSLVASATRTPSTMPTNTLAPTATRTPSPVPPTSTPLPPPPPTATPPHIAGLTPDSYYVSCPLLITSNVGVTYSSSYGATIVNHWATSNNILIATIVGTSTTSSTTLNVGVNCLLWGSAGITVTVVDSLGGTYSTSFTVEH